MNGNNKMTIHIAFNESSLSPEDAQTVTKSKDNFLTPIYFSLF